MPSQSRAAARGRGGHQGQEVEEGREEEEWRRRREAWLRRQRSQFMSDLVKEGVPVRVVRAQLATTSAQAQADAIWQVYNIEGDRVFCGDVGVCRIIGVDTRVYPPSLLREALGPPSVRC
jgi:hypothetical protein